MLSGGSWPLLSRNSVILDRVDPTPYIPQLITAAATLLAVLITLLVSGWREDRRLKKQLDQARFDRSFDALLAAFTDYINAGSELRRIIRDVSPERGGRYDHELFASTMTKYHYAGTRLLILAPHLGHLVNDVTHLLNQFTKRHEPMNDDWHKRLARALANILTESHRMLQIEQEELTKPAALSVDESGAVSHNQPQLDETNPSGTTKPIQP